MRKFIVILLVSLPNFIVAQSTLILNSYTPAGIIDAMGKSVIIENKIDSITLKNAVITEQNYYKHIFDSSVILVNCYAPQFSICWYGAAYNNPDNSKALSLCADMRMQNGYNVIYVPPGVYNYSKEWTAKNLQSNIYQGFSLTIRGEGNIWSGISRLNYTGDKYALGIQRGKGVIIEGLYITGNYVAPSGRLDVYPVKNYHAGIMIDYDGTKNNAGSTGIQIRNCWIEGFDVCYDISPNGVTFNADIIDLSYIRGENTRVIVRGSQAQEKGVRINYIACWGRAWTMLQLGRSGKQQAGDYVIYNTNIGPGGLYQLFDLQLSGWNKFSFYGGYAEDVVRIGYIAAADLKNKMPINIDGLSMRLTLRSVVGSQYIISSEASRLKISNSYIGYFGSASPDTMYFNGPVLFDNCSFGGASLIAPQTKIIDNEPNLRMPELINVGKPSFQLN